MPDRLMTVKEVAAYLQVTTYKVRIYLRDKLLIGSKIAERKTSLRTEWRVSKQDLMDFVKKGSNR